MATITTCGIALKEWAVVCRALATGVQTVLFRKGGISEPGGSFRCEHEAFWLYPTRFHQGAESLTLAGAALLDGLTAPTDPGQVPISLFARVQSVQRITDPAHLTPYLDRQILSPETVLQRFHYKRPELFVIEVACTALPLPFTVQESIEMAGCHSWVELREEYAVPSGGLCHVQ